MLRTYGTPCGGWLRFFYQYSVPDGTHRCCLRDCPRRDAINRVSTMSHITHCTPHTAHSSAHSKWADESDNRTSHISQSHIAICVIRVLNVQIKTILATNGIQLRITNYELRVVFQHRDLNQLRITNYELRTVLCLTV